jgi:triphosphatase
MEEVELKFEVPSKAKAPLLAALRKGQVTEQRLQATYFDTADERLAHNRMALRLRREGRQWVQTLKGATADSIRRLEHNVVITGAVKADPPALNAALHAGTAVGEALREAMAEDRLDEALEERPLQSRYGTDVRRTSREIRVKGARVEVALDVGWIIAKGQRMHLCEVEFELKAGAVDGLVALAQRWVEQYGLWLNTVSKAERGTRLARGELHGAPVKSKELFFRHKATAARVIRDVAANCLDQITANASEVAAGSDAADHVHQLRVGIRRMRTALREMHAFDPGMDRHWEVALQKAFSELGEYRDRETVLGQMEPQLKAAGAPATNASNLPAQHHGPAPRQTVLTPTFQITLLQLLRFVLSAAEDDEEGRQEDARTLFALRLKKLHGQVASDGRRFTTLDVGSQHRVRKRLKRLRYLAEFAAPLFGAKKVKRYLDELRPAQDMLGLHNDEIVALATYRQEAATNPHAAFATGWLVGRQADSAARCQRVLARVSQAHRFWKKTG